MEVSTRELAAIGSSPYCKQEEASTKQLCVQDCTSETVLDDSLLKKTSSPSVWRGRLRSRHPSIKARKDKKPEHSSRRSLFSLQNLQNLDLKDIKRQLKAHKRKRSREDAVLKPQNSENKEPKKKKAFKLSSQTEMSSTVEERTPVPQSPSQRKKVGGNIVQRSFSLRVGSAKDEDFAKKYRILPTPVKKRPSKSWRDTVSKGHVQKLSPIQLRRQEAIYELSSGEEGVVSDLKMMKEVYYKPMYKLRMMTEYEFQTIFGCIETLLEIHTDIIEKLKTAKSSDGTMDNIGEIMLEWFPRLSCYVKYCANQFAAKAMLDEKIKNDDNVKDFLQRCQASPFSRKLDLWSFLDSPRSRLVKYPLMIKSIMKLTPRDHPDRSLLENAIRCVEDIIEQVDEKTGEAKCQYVLSRIVFLYDSQMCPDLFKSKKLLCSGILKNKHGTKLHAFLFEKVFLLTRPATRAGRSSYQVFTEPMKAEYLFVEDLPDGDVRLGGSFKTAISRLATSKNVLRVSSTDHQNGQSHTLQASSEPDKRQWLSALSSIVDSANYKTFI